MNFQIQEERLNQIKATQFKAQPAKVLTQEPFKVKLDPNKHLTEVQGFALSTEKRAEERKVYDEYLKRREEEIELAKREVITQDIYYCSCFTVDDFDHYFHTPVLLFHHIIIIKESILLLLELNIHSILLFQFEQLRIQKEEEETARIRQETDFVANPIRMFKPVEIKRIEDDFTVPKTPKFMKH